MRKARDILVAGIGFLLGMVFCYFLMAPKSEPKIGNVAMNGGRPFPILQTPAPAAAQTNGIRRVILDPNTLRAISDPDWWLKPNGTHPRIVPARGGNDHGVYDLIDLNYVPDFEINLE